MPKFPDQPFTAVYVIYSADVVGTHADMTRMSPASHMRPATTATRIPNGRASRRCSPKPKVTTSTISATSARRAATRVISRLATSMLRRTVEPDADTDPELIGCGSHRKWVADLTRDEWLIFADAYLIDLDNTGYPERYEETMGSLTEHGHLEAIAVDNSEGWQGGYGPQFVDSNMYVSFAYDTDPNGG